MQPGKSPRCAWLASIVAAALLALAPAAALAVPSGSNGQAGAPAFASLAPEASGSYLPGEAIVRFKAGASARTRQAAREAARASFADTLRLPHAQVVRVEGDVGTAVRKLEEQPGVAYAQPNYRYEAQAVPAPDDSFFGQLWGLSDPALPDPGVGALDAWETTEGGGEVIAVLDTGVDLTHPDLIGNLWNNPSPGSESDVHGYDFVDEDGNPDDYNFHGTHVAGTAAATAGNALGIAGVAPAAQIMAVRVLDGDGSGSTDVIAAGIDYAADHGADVINMSLGGPSGSGDQAMKEAIEHADENNVVVVVAAGNEAADNDVEPHTPCALPNPNLICVAALAQSGKLASFSNYGFESVDIAAPGTSILSAKTDYGPTLFGDGFETGLGAWETEAVNGGVPWGPSSPGANDAQSATDSPSETYGQGPPGSIEYAESALFTSAPIDLTGERGCREHFNTAYEIEADFDGFVAGAFSGSDLDGEVFDGTSFGFPGFIREEASISELDGLSTVHPLFGVFSDESVELDGAYVDDVRVFCRDESYVNAIATGSNYDQPDSGNYVSFQGTSMATPHVAGEVALVRAAAPGLNATQVVNAVLEGASAIPQGTAGKRTATEGIADAGKAIAIATEASAVPPDEELPTSISVQPIPPSPAPNTFIRKHPPRVIQTGRRSVRRAFGFGSDQGGVTFLCRVDRQRFRRCGARFVRRYSLGRHVLRVKARRNSDGATDATPAVFRFRVRHVRHGAITRRHTRHHRR